MTELEKINRTLEQSNKLLQIMANNTKMLHNLEMAIDRLSDTIIELPPAPPLSNPPITDPEEYKSFKATLEAAIAEIKEIRKL